MDKRLISEALELALEVGSDAGELLLRGYRTPTETRKKSRFDLVTEYDLRSEELIRRRIGDRFPNHRVVGEETSSIDEEKVGAREGELVWYVDPVDGTTNFAHGHPVFCVSLALCSGRELLVGVVVAPVLKTVWWGSKGGGAFRNGERCQVSSCETLEDALCSTGFPYNRAETTDNNQREFVAFMTQCQGIRRCGSAAIDLAMVADGTYDVYWEQSLHTWDLAGGAVLVTEAGGRVTDYNGSAADIHAGRLVATNGRLHDQTVAILRKARVGL